MNMKIEKTFDINTLRNDMLRFARLQLRDDHLVEDVVQDAIVAALSGSQQFTGQAEIKTWIFAILRNKIIDVFRERSRHPTCSYSDDNRLDEEEDEFFNKQGFWYKEQRPTEWEHPEATFVADEFWRVFEACLTSLPENTARVFMMREFIGLDVAEICNELRISENNCWTILHRARMRLRSCLEKNWFNNEEPKC